MKGVMSTDLDDFRNLMQRVSEGSDNAAWEVVERYGDAIRRAVRRALDRRLRSKFDSLDFVQLVWSSFFRVRDRATRFAHPGELVTFLLKVTCSKVGMETRRRLRTDKFNVKRERSLRGSTDPSLAHMSARQDTPSAFAIARERWDRIMEESPEHYRQIIRMRLQGHTCEEIADSLHLAESTVRRFLKRLLKARSR
jgi:RNA polymerase sigma-70 factor (ECF subfamily)